MNRNANKYFTEVDSVRGLAALIVTIGHWSGMGLFPIPFFINGSAGMILLYVISGFIIHVALRELSNLPLDQAKIYYKNFIIRRLHRLAPLLCLLFIIAFLEALYLFITTKDPYTLHKFFEILVSFTSFTFPYNHVHFDAFNNIVNKSLGVSWSLNIEFVFYLVFPLFLIFVKDKNAQIKILLKLILFSYLILKPFIFNFTPKISLYFNHLGHIESFSAGALIYYFYDNIFEHVSRNKKFYCFLSFYCVFCLTYFPAKVEYVNSNFAYTYVYFLTTFFAVILVIISSLDLNLTFNKLYLQRLFTILGKRSYGIYLFHYWSALFIDNITSKYLATIFIKARNIELSRFLITIIFLALVVELTHRYVEKRFIEIGKKKYS